MVPESRADGPRTVVYAFLDLGDGGAQRLTLTACRHLDRARYRPVILCARGGGALVESAASAGLPVHQLGRLRHPFDLAAVPVMARALEDLGADIVHVGLYSRGGPYIRLAARLAGVPLTVAHEWSRPSPPSRGRRLADRLLAPGARFIATSEAHRGDLRVSGVAPRQIEVVHSGIDVDAFAPVAPAAARSALGLPRERPIVVVPARLHPMKGHVDLIAAVARLCSVVPEVLVVCAGDGPLRPVLPALARAAGVGPAFRFVGQRHDVPVLLGAADVVALASRVEGLPSVVLEAFAAERAVVATDVGGVGEAVRDGVTGWLVPARDPRALGDALVEALSRPDLRAGRARAGKALVDAQFRAENTTLTLQAVYDRWLDEVERPTRLGRVRARRHARRAGVGGVGA